MIVRPWAAVDVAWLRGAIEAFLAANAARGGDLIVNERNVTTYLQLGMGGALRGDPCLVAILKEHPVGFVLWVGTPNPPLDSRWKTINALGSYTEPEARSKGVADALRRAAWDMTVAQGYERVHGPMHLSNARGIEEFIHVWDAWPTTCTFEVMVNGRG